MNKKDLEQDLLKYKFKKVSCNSFENDFNGISLMVTLYSSLFGKIKMIGIVYKFNKELHAELHEEVWNKSDSLFKKSTQDMEVGSLGFDFIEIDILKNDIILTINGEQISKACFECSNILLPIIKEYNI